MKDINKYIIEKLHLDKDIDKQENYTIADGKTIEDVKDWIHNEWNGKDSFLVSKVLSTDEISELIDYMIELDNNVDPGRASYWDDDDYDDKYWLINVDLDG